MLVSELFAATTRLFDTAPAADLVGYAITPVLVAYGVRRLMQRFDHPIVLCIGTWAAFSFVDFWLFNQTPASLYIHFFMFIGIGLVLGVCGGLYEKMRYEH